MDTLLMGMWVVRRVWVLLGGRGRCGGVNNVCNWIDVVLPAVLGWSECNMCQWNIHVQLVLNFLDCDIGIIALTRECLTLYMSQLHRRRLNCGLKHAMH